MIRSQNVIDHEFSKHGLAFIDDSQAHKLKNVAVEPNDILLNITGDSVARTCIVDSSVLPARVNQHVAIIRVSHNIADPRFIHAWLIYKKAELLNLASFGATRNAITKKMIDNFSVNLPPLSEQKKIADTLSSLDEKIETNRKINARLEELAQAIFKSWFIDFEPFGSKKPADWELKSLSGIANYLNGLAMQKYPPINNHDKLPVLKIKELGEGRINDNSDFCSKANIGSNHIIENGDIIFSWSGTLLVKIWTGGKCGLNQHLFKVTSNQYPKWFYYFWTLHHNEEFKRIAKDKAVTMGHIKREELDKALVSVPPLDIMHRISGIMDPIFNQLISTNLESARLSALRDTLLPKLMSGELIPE